MVQAHHDKTLPGACSVMNVAQSHMPERHGQTVIVLWGRQRNPQAENAKATPANVDKGVRELLARGIRVISLYPSSMRLSLSRRILGQRGVYRTTTPAMVRIARRTGGVIYTSSLEWARIVAGLKKRGILKNRLIFRWAGIDTDVHAIANGLPEGRADAEVLRQADVCLVASLLFQRTLVEAAPEFAHKLQFWPTGVDTGFYAGAVTERAPDSLTTWDIAAVGSDRKRDWALPLSLAERGLRVALLTEDAKVQQRLVEQTPASRANAELFFRAGFAESARIMVRAKCVLIATLPNIRFSGSTTVGVAAALAKPLVLDDPEEAPGYGLVEGQNCEFFRRGDTSAAYSAVRRILDNPAHAARLAENISSLAGELDLSEYAAALEKCFSPDWVRHDFRSSVATASAPRRKRGGQDDSIFAMVSELSPADLHKE
jgi:hypothetical protein